MLGDPCRPQAQGDRCDRRSVRPLHPAGHSRLHPVRQRTGVRRQGSTGMDRGCRCQDSLHRARQPLGERVHRELQRSPARRAARRRNLLHSPRGPNRHRELAAALQHDQAARIARIQAASTGGICPCLRRVAGCATPTGSASHASATASLKLTFHLDYPVGANQPAFRNCWSRPPLYPSYGTPCSGAWRRSTCASLMRAHLEVLFGTRSGSRRFALALLAALLLAGCDTRKEPTFQGWVEAELIFVGPDETGRVEMLTVREGDQVERGMLLFTIDPDLQQADVAMQEAAVKNAQQAYDRAQQLLKTQAGTQKNLDDAEAALRTAQARLNSAQTRLSRRKVFSPVTGSVQQIYYRGGELVPAGKPILALLPPGNLKVRFFVNEATLPKLKFGDPVTVTCDGCERDITAKISFISRTSEFTPPVIYSMDERSKLVFLIEARPERPERLRVGQPVSVALGQGQ